MFVIINDKLLRVRNPKKRIIVWKITCLILIFLIFVLFFALVLSGSFIIKNLGIIFKILNLFLLFFNRFKLFLESNKIRQSVLRARLTIILGLFVGLCCFSLLASAWSSTCPAIIAILVIFSFLLLFHRK